MEKLQVNQKQIRDFLMKNWMTHDALWYTEVAHRFGMAEASPMNLRVCRKLGQIECKRVMKQVEVPPPGNMMDFRQLFELAERIFVPDFMTFRAEYPGSDLQQVHVFDCFAYNGMYKAGLVSEYECGIFERIEGWFDAMGLAYTRSPDLSRCLKHRGKDCVVTFQFEFTES
ncbi:MAG: DUF6125 family protein [Desulfobacteraceae bacterium]|jgi:hypothetical protein